MESKLFIKRKLLMDSIFFFTEIGPKLASLIPTTSKDFKQFMDVSETVLQECSLQDQDLDEAFNS